MYRCATRGVLAASAALVLTLFATTQVTGTEFANVLGVGQDDAKRASVQALDALSKIFAAIKKIEEEGPNAGADALLQAAGQLDEAAKMMSAVKLNQSPQAIDYTSLLVSDKFLLETSGSKFGFGAPPTNLNELYSGFTTATTSMSADIAAAVKSGKPVLPQIADKLAAYIQLGGAVSRIFEKSQKQ